MLLSVLRVAGQDLDVDAFLAAHPDLEPDAVWRKGEVHRVLRSRGPHTDSGVNVTLVAEEATWADLVKATFAELERLRPALADVRALAASAEVDFGVEVASDEFVRSLRLQEDELRRAADLGVRLCVSVYPAERQVVKVGLALWAVFLLCQLAPWFIESGTWFRPLVPLVVFASLTVVLAAALVWLHRRVRLIASVVVLAAVLVGQWPLVRWLVALVAWRTKGFAP